MTDWDMVAPGCGEDFHRFLRRILLLLCKMRLMHAIGATKLLKHVDVGSCLHLCLPRHILVRSQWPCLLHKFLIECTAYHFGGCSLELHETRP